MGVETSLSMVTVICDLKRIRHRMTVYIQMHLSYVSAMFNVLLDLFQFIHPGLDPYKISNALRPPALCFSGFRVAEFSL